MVKKYSAIHSMAISVNNDFKIIDKNQTPLQPYHDFMIQSTNVSDSVTINDSVISNQFHVSNTL